MLTVTKIGSASGASRYLSQDGYAEAQSQTAAGEYYTNDGDIEAAMFHGKAAEVLGLDGKQVTKEQLNQLLTGTLPTGEQLPGGAGKNRAPGWDATFSAPKSVSVAALVHGDERLITAHDEAVAAALAKYEAEHAMTRIKSEGEITNVKTGNIIAATFRHDTNRNLDPQLHTHSVIFNATQTADGKWRALETQPLFAQKMALGEYYRQELAARVQELGYEIEPLKEGETEKQQRFNFELRAVNTQTINHFSSRSKEIEAALEARGQTRETATTAEKQTAALDTRSAKEAPESRQALQQQWRDEAQALGQLLEIPQVNDQYNIGRKQLILDETLRSVEKLSERENRITINDIYKDVSKRFPGTSESQVKTALKTLETDKSLQFCQAPQYDIPTKTTIMREGVVTTANIEREREMLTNTQTLAQNQKTAHAYIYKTTYLRGTQIVEVEKKTAEQTKSILTQDQTNAALAKAEEAAQAKGYSWNEQQRAATIGILADESKLHVVQGLAGTAKTSSVLKTVAAEAQRQGRTMVAVAPSQSATQKLADETGIKDARNLSKVLADAKDFDERSQPEFDIKKVYLFSKNVDN